MLSVFEGDCACYSTTTSFIRELNIKKYNKTHHVRAKIKRFDDIDFRIREVVDEELIISVLQKNNINRDSKMISSEKVMITVFWNPKQITLIDTLQKSENLMNCIIQIIYE